MSILVIGEMSPEAYAKAKTIAFEDGFDPRDVFPLALHQFYMVDDVVVDCANRQAYDFDEAACREALRNPHTSAEVLKAATSALIGLPVTVDAIVIQRQDLSAKHAQDYFPDRYLEEAQSEAMCRARILLEQLARISTETPVYVINLDGSVQLQSLRDTLLASFHTFVMS